jgi:hypothetical protein
MNIVVRGADHPDTARNRINLAHMLREQRRFAEARAELALAGASLQRSLPATHPSVVLLEIYVAQVDEAEGHWDGAVQTARRVVGGARRTGDPATLRFALGELARMTAHAAPADALAIYDEVLRLNLAQQGRSVHADVEALRELADVALRARRPAAALAWFDRMPDAAGLLADVRRRLEGAKLRRP